ncbi:hypothetical protein QBC35DRAFT_267518 [Podospora australis]|uniref:C2H2-type domain-containing protein n=1 Tax=Podospora australis TaxID=1536484 RepID=A0AAN6WRT3_9PEZI|nr:hypothetical protein QBC35DRAFT_267518 [Podospora australis]
MASSKEIQQTSRPMNHRPSLSSASSLPGGLSLARQSHSRNHSHSIIGSALNGAHRVTRRKSMTNTGANVAAVAAALSESGDMSIPVPIGVRRNTLSKNGLSRSVIAGSLPSPPASLPTRRFVTGNETTSLQEESAIDDELNDVSGDDAESAFQKARVRRASDGQPLVKEGGRKSNRPELRCEKCGKGYKHSSCLTKHLWEHTPEWSYTSKLLISKHQQVQLLEAASVLVAMNKDAPTTPPDSARDFNSEQGSASPAASGYSDQHDRSSADTTPPPQLDAIAAANASFRNNFSKRHSNGSGFSRSYQSAPFASAAGSVPNGSGLFGHFRQLSQDHRPTSSGKNTTSQDDRELAAAVELLSCSFNSTGGRGTVHLPSDAPPVPPLPAQYLDQAILSGTSFIGSFPSRAPESFTRGEIHHRVDVKMEEADSIMDDDDDDTRSRARSDEDDDGVFGRMDE